VKISIQRFLQSEHGVTAIEYALLAGLISVVIVLTVTAVGSKVGDLFNYVKDQLVAASS
jgi:pilus assembly protein Flp/PilA